MKLSPDGMIKLYNHSGTVNVLVDVVGYYTNSTLKELAAEIAQLKAATKGACQLSLFRVSVPTVWWIDD